MRLIDADKLKPHEFYDGFVFVEAVYMDDIREMPTVDAEPIRHGHWEKLYTNNYKCSVCGSWWTDDGDTYLIEFNYCPNCGAKMDEVEKKEIKKICILSNGTLKEEYDIPNVIRCKDCKYWDDDIDRYCILKDSFNWDADDFCSRGEKK